MTSSAIGLQIKWEYQSLTRVSEAALIEALNEAGRESWELVSAAHYRDVGGMMTWTAILKRPVAEATGRASGREAAAPAVAALPTGRGAEEETDFELNVAAAPPARPHRPAPKPSTLGPAKPRVEISDDFDFELADTTSAAKQPTRQVKAKPAAAEEDFDFELGETFPTKLQPAKPPAPKPAAAADDETDFDLG